MPDNEEKDFMLTTVDNPYNPFTNFDAWYQYDISHGYYTCQLLASLAFTSDGLSDAYNKKIIKESIDSILSTDYGNQYKLIYE